MMIDVLIDHLSFTQARPCIHYTMINQTNNNTKLHQDKCNGSNYQTHRLLLYPAIAKSYMGVAWSRNWEENISTNRANHKMLRFIEGRKLKWYHSNQLFWKWLRQVRCNIRPGIVISPTHQTFYLEYRRGKQYTTLWLYSQSHLTPES